MVRRKFDESNEPLPPPATTLEGREDQLIAAAMDLAERRMAEGTASAAEVVHFLKAGSRINQLQLAKLENEVDTLKARLKEAEERKGMDELYAEALEAFKGYSGQIPVDPDYLEDYYDENL